MRPVEDGDALRTASEGRPPSKSLYAPPLPGDAVDELPDYRRQRHVTGGYGHGAWTMSSEARVVRGSVARSATTSPTTNVGPVSSDVWLGRESFTSSVIALSGGVLVPLVLVCPCWDERRVGRGFHRWFGAGSSIDGRATGWLDQSVLARRGRVQR